MSGEFTEQYIKDLEMENKELKEQLVQRNENFENQFEISCKYNEENAGLKKEIEKIKGEKKKEYQRAQKLVTERDNAIKQADKLAGEKELLIRFIQKVANYRNNNITAIQIEKMAHDILFENANKTNK